MGMLTQIIWIEVYNEIVPEERTYFVFNGSNGEV